jgi:Na+/glutamate symporter
LRIQLARHLRKYLIIKTPEGEFTMDKHTGMGVFVGGIFAAIIAAIASLHGFAAGGFVLLASAVFGLAAGLCIGGLIAANFAMLGKEEKKNKEVPVESKIAARAAA